MTAIAHYNRGLTLNIQDKPEEAIAEFCAAMRLDGDDVGEAPFALGQTLRRVGRYQEALAPVSRAPQAPSVTNREAVRSAGQN